MTLVEESQGSGLGIVQENNPLLPALVDRTFPPASVGEGSVASRGWGVILSDWLILRVIGGEALVMRTGPSFFVCFGWWGGCGGVVGGGFFFGCCVR